MKKILITFILLSITPSTFAQAPDREKIIGESLDYYATIAGAWHLNNKCTFLGEDLAKSFEQDVALITVSLRRMLVGNEQRNPKILLDIQNASKKTAESEKYSECGENAEGIVHKSVLNARNFARSIRKAEVANKPN